MRVGLLWLEGVGQQEACRKLQASIYRALGLALVVKPERLIGLLWQGRGDLRASAQARSLISLYLQSSQPGISRGVNREPTHSGCEEIIPVGNKPSRGPQSRDSECTILKPRVRSYQSVISIG